MNKILNQLGLSSEFSKNILVIATGITVSNLFPLLIFPILTRFYTPEDFGVFALYVSIYSVVGLVAAGRYECAILLPEKEEDAVNILVLSGGIVFLVSIIAWLVIFIFNAQIISLLGNRKFHLLLYLVPASVFLLGFYNNFNYWANRKKQYHRISTSKIGQGVFSGIIMLAAGICGLGYLGLVIGSILGQIFANIVLGYELYRKKKVIAQQVSLKKILQLSKRFIDYPKKSAFGAFFNAISHHIEYFLFSIGYNFIDLGYYYFVNKIVSSSGLFMSTAVWQVFLGENRNKTKEEIFSTVSFCQNKMFKMITLPFFSSLFIVGNLFILLFGQKWSAAVHYLCPLIIAGHINLIVASFSLFIIVNKPGAEMLFNIVLFSLKVIVIILSYLFFQSMFLAVIMVSVVRVMMYTLLGSWNYKQLGKSYFYFYSVYIKNLLRIVPEIAILFIFQYISKDLLWLFLGVIVVNIFHFRKIKQHVEERAN